MQKGMVDLAKYQDIIEYRKDKDDYQMSGSEGYCFLERNKIIKIYAHPKEVHRITDLTDYKSERIAFPIYYIYKKGLVYGEVMPYFKAKTLDAALGVNTRVENITYHYQNIIDIINVFNDLLMIDISYARNILYSPTKGFYLIDTTAWEKDKEKNSQNIHAFDACLFNRICPIIFDSCLPIHVLLDIKDRFWLIKNDVLGKEFFDLLNANLKGDYHIIELFDAYKSVVKTYYNDDVKTLGDVKKYTKIMKNS